MTNSLTVYENRAVLFLDILGFSQLVKEGKEQKLLTALQHLQGRALQAHGLGHLNFTSFSDCVVVSTPVGDGSGILKIVYYAQFLALDLLSRGLLTRGAVVVGPLFHNRGIVLGPALIEAYALESKKALYPRILVSSGIISGMVDAVMELTSGTLPDGISYFRQDFDGSYHVDIFTKSASRPESYQDDQDDEPAAMSASFRDALSTYIDRIFSVTPPAIAAEKYAWLANYFFESCQRNGWHLPDNLPIQEFKRKKHEQELLDQAALDRQE